MPIKNAMPFLTECLDSIILQTEINWELCAVDDHSTDNSFSILKKYAQKDKRIKAFENDGIGIIPALQLGYSKSSGNFITRMDADDIMPNRKLSLLRKAIEHQPQAISTGLVEYFPKEIIKGGFKKYETWLNQLTATNSNFKEIYKECVIPSPCWMAHRKDFEAIGGFESEVYPEDYDLCFRFYKHKLKVVGVNEILHKWRDYPTRTSRTNPNYSDNRFLDLKIKYFLEIDRKIDKPLIVWGAGKKGKAIAKILVEREIEFDWLTNNSKKIGKEIYGKPLQSEEDLQKFKNPQLIILVANEEEQNAILQILSEKEIKDYFFFC